MERTFKLGLLAASITLAETFSPLLPHLRQETAQTIHGHSFLQVSSSSSLGGVMAAELSSSSAAAASKKLENGRQESTTDASDASAASTVAASIATSTKRSSSSLGRAGSLKKTWEPEAAEEIYERYRESDQRPFMVSLVGIPGSGKSTCGLILLEELKRRQPDLCPILIPHDGYHHPMAHLRGAENSADLIYRRGAPDTFDTDALCRDLRRIRSSGEPSVSIPGFDHARGDPEPDAHTFRRSRNQLVICEGLYLLHDRDGWIDDDRNIPAQFDFSIFIESDVDECIERVKIRNKCLPGYTPEEIDIRCDVVDRANAILVNESRSRADLVVKSAVSAS